MTNLEEFRRTLEADRMYQVKNANYKHVLPRDMSYSDLSELASRKQIQGESSIVEGSIQYRNNLIG